MTFTKTLSHTTSPVFQANTINTGDQDQASVLGLRDGGFVVGYHNASTKNVIMDFYDASGHVVHGGRGGSPDAVRGAMHGPDLVQLGSGSVGSLWSDEVNKDSGDHGRFFSPEGIIQTAEIDLGNFRDSFFGDAVGLSSGGFVIAETSDGKIWSNSYNNAGHLLHHTVASGSHDSFDPRVVELAGGGYVVIYKYVPDTLNLHYELWAHVFNENGTSRQAPFKMSRPDDQLDAEDIAALPNGGFALVHRTTDTGGPVFQHVVMRMFAPGATTQFNAPVVVSDNNGIGSPHIRALDNGLLLVSWTDGSHILGRLYDAAGNAQTVGGSDDAFIIADKGDVDAIEAVNGGQLVVAWTDAHIEAGSHGSGIAAQITTFVRHGEGDDANDTGVGDSFRDQYYGGGGDDHLAGMGGADYLVGEAGKDTLDGGTGADVLFGGTENDMLLGGSGDDVISGEENDDSLDGGSGADTMNGGAENDSLIGGSGNDVMSGDQNNDSLDGGSGNDTLSGGDDNDTLLGGSGNDRLAGDKGINDLRGGTGDDVYVLDYTHLVQIGSLFLQAFDTVTEAKAEGTDTVRVQGSDSDGFQTIGGYTLGANIENGVVTSEHHFVLTGNTLANKLSAGAGDQTLVGLSGADAFTGGAGADTMSGGAGLSTADDGARDVFRYIDKSDSGADSATEDVIWGHFNGKRPDKIDLSGLDANGAASRNGTFHFVGDASFTKTVGEVQVRATANAHEYLVRLDMDKDSGAEMQILVHSNVALTAGDFVL